MENDAGEWDHSEVMQRVPTPAGVANSREHDRLDDLSFVQLASQGERTFDFTDVLTLLFEEQVAFRKKYKTHGKPQAKWPQASAQAEIGLGLHPPLSVSPGQE